MRAQGVLPWGGRPWSMKICITAAYSRDIDIRGCEYSPVIRATVHVRYGVHARSGIAHPWKMVSSPIYWLGEPHREREYVFPDSTDTYDKYEACAMRTCKPLHCLRSFCSVSRLRFTAVRSGIHGAPTNELLDTLAFTGPETQDFSALRPVASAFRTAFDSYCAGTNVGRSILRTSEVTAGRPR